MSGQNIGDLSQEILADRYQCDRRSASKQDANLTRPRLKNPTASSRQTALI